MLATVNDWKAKRDELKVRRRRLFERYLKSPGDTTLALEIKLIDDQVAEYTSQMDQTRPSPKSRK